MGQNRKENRKNCLVEALYGTKRYEKMAELSRRIVLWDKTVKEIERTV
nr:hypothetical protein [Lysinibacillus timonensis]